MKTNQIGNVRVFAQKGHANRHNYSHNVYTSCGFGEVQPTFCRLCDADSKTLIKNEFLTYLANLNAPTYGHVKQDFWHYFVEMEDLFTIFPQLMAQTQVPELTGGSGVLLGHAKVQPQHLPNVSRNILSLLPLIASHCTVYRVENSLNDGRQLMYVPDEVGAVNQATTQAAFLNELNGSMRSYINGKTGGNLTTDYLTARTVTGMDIGYPSIALDIRALIDNVSIDGYALRSYDMLLPLSVPNAGYLTEVRNSDGSTQLTAGGVDVAPVDLDSADFIIERDFNWDSHHPANKRYIFAFRMHAFGKRLYKILKGLGFQEDFTSSENVSIAPFLALFKAYWGSFGVEWYENYDNTYGSIICRNFDASGGQSRQFDTMFIETSSPSLPYDAQFASTFVKGFFFSLGSLWVTDSQDFVSANQREITNSASIDSTFIRSFTPVGNLTQNPVNQTTTATGAQSTSSFGEQGYAYIDNIFHGQLSSEVLKKQYLYTNANTMAGKRIRELLEIQGLGHWADKQKVRFIGHDSKEVDFDQVVSQANTLQQSGGTISGDLLGGRGGRGQIYFEGNSKHYHHNANIGFIISMCAIVPDAGYTQQWNSAFDCIGKFDFFNRMFDGAGYEATRIKQINGERPIKLLNHDGTEPIGDTERTFGYIARMSKFKVQGNVLSGHFAKRSTRDYYLTYNTDRVLQVGEINKSYDQLEAKTSFNGTSVNYGARVVEMNQVFPFGEFPLAGPHWRYTTRWPWLGNFSRIFASVGDNGEKYHTPIDGSTLMFYAYEYVNNEEDGFSVMSTLSVTQNNQMLQIADSFETTDDGNDGKTNTNISKA